jgi:phosphoribosylglycinamide formyltransferase-1
MRLALMASGTGSNVEVLLSEKKNGRLPLVDWVLLGCDRPNALVIQKAKSVQLTNWVHSPSEFTDKASYEKSLHQALISHEVEGIVLAGYMRLIGPTLLEHWQGRIINIHPALLPLFRGRHSIRDALKHRVKLTGCTTHFVDEGMDTGPIIAQQSIPISSTDNEETLAKKIQRLEHSLLPKTVRQWSEGRFYLKDGIVHFADEVEKTL